MAKFFLKKDKDSKRPMHSQVVGIVWVSIVLLFITALAIFLPHKDKSITETDSTMISDTTILAQKEDSVYRSRRRTYPISHNYSKQEVSSTEKFDTVTPMKRKPLSLEINSADTLTLQLLHGIGPAYARRIVTYRNRLGGFIRKEQLLEVNGITPELLSHIAPYITVDTTVRTLIPINTIELKQLVKHPYIEYFQARDIIKLRNAGQRFTTADDLRAVPSMTESSLVRLLPYISFE